MPFKNSEENRKNQIKINDYQPVTNNGVVLFFLKIPSIKSENTNLFVHT